LTDSRELRQCRAALDWPGSWHNAVRWFTMPPLRSNLWLTLTKHSLASWL